MTDTYSLAELAAMTGLTDRTLRNYLKQGLLQGEMTSKGYAFTVQNITEFFAHPTVVFSLRVKKTAAVMDFLAARHKQSPQACLILDLPQTDGAVLSRRFSDLFNQSAAGDQATFSYEFSRDCSRVILTGPAAEVLSVAQTFTNETKK